MIRTPSVVVVLGAEVFADGEPSPTLARRVGWGIDLMGRGDGQWLLVTGAAIAGRPSEARVMARLALDRGVPSERIVLEETARTTWENARECARIIRERGWRRVVLVTDDFHRPRAMLAFRAFGVRAMTCQICRGRAGSPLGISILLHLRELVAIPFYGLRVLVLKLIGAGGL